MFHFTWKYTFLEPLNCVSEVLSEHHSAYRFSILLISHSFIVHFLHLLILIPNLITSFYVYQQFETRTKLRNSSNQGFYSIKVFPKTFFYFFFADNTNEYIAKSSIDAELFLGIH